MTRIYISDHGSDENDGLTKRTPIYSWKRASRLAAGHLEISVDSTSTRKRLVSELCARHRTSKNQITLAEQLVRNEGMHCDHCAQRPNRD